MTNDQGFKGKQAALLLLLCAPSQSPRCTNAVLCCAVLLDRLHSHFIPALHEFAPEKVPLPLPFAVDFARALGWRLAVSSW